MLMQYVSDYVRLSAYFARVFGRDWIFDERLLRIGRSICPRVMTVPIPTTLTSLALYGLLVNGSLAADSFYLRSTTRLLGTFASL